MKLRILIATFGLVLAGLVATPATADSAPSRSASASAQTHACTRTSSGTCIRGGQFCPQSKYGRSGWDASGRRYVCKGNRTHPHWMRP
jgi:hypothetical protein